MTLDECNQLSKYIEKIKDVDHDDILSLQMDILPDLDEEFATPERDRNEEK